MSILEILKQKTSTKDLVNIGASYYEAKSVKEYLKLVKQCKGLDFTQCPKTQQLTVGHDNGKACFNPVTLKDYSGADNVTYIGHATKSVWCKTESGYITVNTTKTGRAWEIKL